MDSKFLKVTLLLCFLFMSTVFFVVLYVNGMGPGQKKQKANIQEEATVPEVLTGQIGNDLYGWMEDDSFFEETTILQEQDPKAIKVHLTAVSVEKDIRVCILGNDEKPIEGQFFKIKINDTDEYLDLDRDGIIYISDLSAGEYQVSMEAREGYAVPVGTTPVKVKDRVEYKQIADISILIKTENDVDVLVEDAGKIEEMEEGSEPTDLRKDSVAKLGMDISCWNEEINWNKVKDSGVEYAIIRAGYRAAVSGVLVEDKYFKKNMEEAARAGIPVGIYFLSQAVTEAEAVEEASMVLSLCKEYDITYPFFVDLTGAGGNGRADQLGTKERTIVAQAFCETVRREGFEAGIYGDKNTLEEKIDRSVLTDDTNIWLSESGDAVTYEGGYHIWQYTSSGRVLGMEGRVCLNLSFWEP